MVVASGVTVDAPTGQYDKTKLINLGTNRWGFKPEIGLSYPLRRFDLEVYAGLYLFAANSNYYPGHAFRIQETLSAVQAHVSYTIRRGLWAAIDSTWYGGGSVRVNNGPAAERQSSSSLGTTFSFPLSNYQSIKISYSSGVTARVGSNFNTLGVSWQYLWLEKH
jgi:Putative MetA-pathway of phenol degradation